MRPYYSDDLVTIYHGDCLDVLPDLAIRAQAILTDPPFFMPAEHYGGANWSSLGIKRSWGDASVLGQWWGLVLDGLMPRLAKDGVLLTFCSDASYPVMYPPTFRRFDGVSALIWDKGRIGTGKRWRRTYELVMYARNVDSYWREEAFDYSDILRFSPTASINRAHPVDKPTELLVRLMEPAVPFSGLVLDPFLGGGSTLVAAKATGRKAIGIETEERWCEVAANRCRQEVLGLVG